MENYKKIKNFILIINICFYVLLTGCKNSNSEYWKNGAKKSEITYSNGKKNGKALWWYPNGIQQQISNFIDDKLNGVSIRNYSNGNKQSVENYSNDKLDGLCTYYDENGHKISEINYKDGFKDGSYTEWHINGQIKVQGYYQKDNFDKQWNYWNSIGIKVGEANFVKGTGTQLANFYNGKHMREVHYVNNQKDGIEKSWDINGKLLFERTYKDGRIVNEKNYVETDTSSK